LPLCFSAFPCQRVRARDDAGETPALAARYDPGVRRLCRILWTTFAAGSLFCCAAAAVLWVRSYFATDTLDHRYRERAWYLMTTRGTLKVLRVDRFSNRLIAGRTGGWRHRVELPKDNRVPSEYATPLPGELSLPGLVTRSRADDFGQERFVILHLAYPTALFALAPLAWLAGYRKRRRRAARARGGLCASCGYDLRASAGRCPECGGVAAA
jgi:hypothetical protein